MFIWQSMYLKQQFIFKFVTNSCRYGRLYVTSSLVIVHRNQRGHCHFYCCVSTHTSLLTASREETLSQYRCWTYNGTKMTDNRCPSAQPSPTSTTHIKTLREVYLSIVNEKFWNSVLWFWHLKHTVNTSQ